MPVVDNKDILLLIIPFQVRGIPHSTGVPSVLSIAKVPNSSGRVTTYGASQLGLNFCHTPIPGPTRLADPNLVRGARPYTGTLYLFFF